MNKKQLKNNVSIQEKNIQSWVLICYGNILRSQVLEQYLIHFSKLLNKSIEFYSAGIACQDEFPDTDILLLEIHDELKKRNIDHSLNRIPWNNAVESKIIKADRVICADTSVKKAVLKRMHNRVNIKKVFTFYSNISEGEKDFEDTYDYDKNCQDPIRFRNAFNELERIAKKMITRFKI